MSETVLSAAAADRSRMPFVAIDSDALKANWRLLASRAPGARTGAAVKANGYGLGAVPVAKALFEEGCRDFFVAWASEGAALRQEIGPDGRIFVLQGLDRPAARLCREVKLFPILANPDDVALWVESETGAPSPAGLQLETGMNRLGVEEADARRIAGLTADGRLRLVLVMSHLASADVPGSRQSRDQLTRFAELSALFPGVERSLANSAGVFLGSDFHFNVTRPGIALYGGEAGMADQGAIRTVATLTAHVLQVRTAKTGEAAGYGAAAELSRNTRIATVGLGYADGFHRAASGAGTAIRQLAEGPSVFVAGRRAPILGRISMDLTLIDVTGLPEGAVKPGDPVEFFGQNISIDAVARSAGTISYELLTGLGTRVTRVWR
ncbi:alanine racemase [Consotaella salsifontis]|uniref:Alanine racemase n=1 Tax=Consotaella salsifontis TaxID=1365950 RepID=A0A1T4SKC6_9HYPH|nr:alanine racemase [Consotaella salsifontis]SKA28613.1 alanine racemase [Consotaella salsifontis]